MTEFALIAGTGEAATRLRFAEFDEAPAPLAANKGLRWLPVDRSDSGPPEGPYVVSATVEAEVEGVWTVAVTRSYVADLQAVLHQAIDGPAELKRNTILTPGSGQAMEYMETEAEALSADAAPDPLDPEAYPNLDAERLAQIDALPEDHEPEDEPTLRDIIDEVLVERGAWKPAGAAIKRIRRSAKLRVDAALAEEPPNHEAAIAIVTSVDWSLS